MPEVNENTPTQASLERRRRRRTNGNSMADMLDVTQAKLEPLAATAAATATRSAPAAREAEYAVAVTLDHPVPNSDAPEAQNTEAVVGEPHTSKPKRSINVPEAIAAGANRRQSTERNSDREPEIEEERSNEAPDGSHAVGRRSNNDAIKISTRLPSKAIQVMKAIAFYEDANAADVMRDMIDRDLVRRGFPTIAGITACTEVEVNDLVRRAATGALRSTSSD